MTERSMQYIEKQMLLRLLNTQNILPGVHARPFQYLTCF
jgi:hypothetical protein